MPWNIFLDIPTTLRFGPIKKFAIQFVEAVFELRIRRSFHKFVHYRKRCLRRQETVATEAGLRPRIIGSFVENLRFTDPTRDASRAGRQSDLKGSAGAVIRKNFDGS